MIEKLVKWANDNKQILHEKGIDTVKIFINENNVYIDHETSNCIGRVTMNIEGHINVEIIEIESEIKLMSAYYAFQRDFYEDFLEPYIRILLDSTKIVQSKYHLLPIRKK